MTGKREVGVLAEQVAAKALKKAGYRILERNLRLRLGEIDILAVKDGMLVLIEVKGQSGASDFGPALLRVTPRKQRKLRKLALELSARRRLRDTDVRFDVVSVDLGTTPPRVEVIENAF